MLILSVADVKGISQLIEPENECIERKNLVGILQQAHNKGLFNLNLSLENITIECDAKSSIHRA